MLVADQIRTIAFDENLSIRGVPRREIVNDYGHENQGNFTLQSKTYI